jgi:hypothetical protein
MTDDDDVLMNVLIVFLLLQARHLKNSHSSRDSITTLRCGTAAGQKGPSLFLIQAAFRKERQSDAWLASVGCPPGSTVFASDQAYMTDEVWAKAARVLAKHIRNLPVGACCVLLCVLLCLYSVKSIIIVAFSLFASSTIHAILKSCSIM